MKYADYDFYQNTYIGDRITDEATFDRLVVRAGEELDLFTFGRISEADDSVRLAVCAMADVMYWEEKRKNAHDGREISSESNDGYSVSYDGTEASGAGSDLYRAAYKYLSQTGLMDFGVGACS